MKTMKNFAAQQLTKTQMNEVKGGIGTYSCNCTFGSGGAKPGQTMTWLMPLSSKANDLATEINAHCGGGGTCEKKIF